VASIKPVVLDVRVLAGEAGGPDKTILNSPRFLDGLGYTMQCAYMHPPGDAAYGQLVNRAATLGVPLFSVADRGPWDWTVLPQLLSLCRRQRVTIWHGHDYKSNAVGLVLHRFWPMRLVTTVHGWVKHTARTPLYYRIDELCLRRYESVLCVSEDLLERCRACGVPGERCLLLENGIDTEQYRRRQTLLEAKQRLGLRSEQVVVGAVGRLSPEKSFDLLIRAVQQLSVSGDEITLVIVGEGEDRGRLEALARELGLADRVRLLGYSADPRPIYEAMDLFVLSSLREGLPNVVLEAMALEVPVVSTRVAGVPRLIEDGINGLLVPPGSVPDLAQAMRQILADDHLRARLAHAGRSTVVEKYSFAERMKKLAGLYDNLLASGGVYPRRSDHTAGVNPAAR
jgi:glycosyltransferase involved in cell wall biosynthesis